jgi:hypothetical protein
MAKWVEIATWLPDSRYNYNILSTRWRLFPSLTIFLYLSVVGWHFSVIFYMWRGHKVIVDRFLYLLSELLYTCSSILIKVNHWIILKYSYQCIQQNNKQYFYQCAKGQTYPSIWLHPPGIQSDLHIQEINWCLKQPEGWRGRGGLISYPQFVTVYVSKACPEIILTSFYEMLYS